jgi:Mg2+-importing ATPase
VLVIATLAVNVVALALPYTPLAALFGFTPIPPLFLVRLGGILVCYMLTAEVAKYAFYRRMRGAAVRR